MTSNLLKIRRLCTAFQPSTLPTREAVMSKYAVSIVIQLVCSLILIESGESPFPKREVDNHVTSPFLRLICPPIITYQCSFGASLGQKNSTKTIQIGLRLSFPEFCLQLSNRPLMLRHVYVCLELLFSHHRAMTSEVAYIGGLQHIISTVRRYLCIWFKPLIDGHFVMFISVFLWLTNPPEVSPTFVVSSYLRPVGSVVGFS